MAGVDPMGQADTSDPQKHAQDLYSLSARIAALLGAALRGEHVIQGAVLGQSEVVDAALDGQIQYGLLACALEKAALNQAADPAYWQTVGQELTALVSRSARRSADEILRPLAPMLGEAELAELSEALYHPLKAYEGTSLAKLDQGLAGTPLEVLASGVVKSFYAKGDGSAVASRVVELALEGVRELFVKGGLA
ncbi:MAG: hypothetical protein K9K66_01300 [Desulfarculaceae bacterium]|nr:hypothetical protein [Desulfarculaceae bacterium]MCF8072349.1 hypothetical protein [Desulfarculaceae bacterium]MCF8100270.1 hypothetical protein [Desulfarculaceae bacterium]MCF8116157.1 hypothetical protein [Desulfarculaceae bacterium]